MKRKRLLLTAVFSCVFIATALLIGRFYVLERVISSKLESLYHKTGIRVTYEDIAMSFSGARVRNLAFFFDKEKDPFARTDAATFTWSRRMVRVDDVQISRLGVKAAGRGTVYPFKNSLDVEVSMPPTPCEDFLLAIPEKFRAETGGATVEGKLAFDFHFRLDSDRPGLNLLDGALENGCSIKNFGSLPTPDQFRRPFRHRALDAKKKPFEITTGPGTDLWVDFEDISRYMVQSVIEAEDPFFYRHNGIMLSRIETAARINLKRGIVRYGASTITMQTAKNLFLSREKTFARKLQEVFFVWYLESNFTKDEILTLYLNLAEFGPSLYGIKDAAAYYFETAPRDLNLRQSAFLAKLLPNPVGRAESKELGKVPAMLARRIRALLLDMKKNNRITEEEYEEALSEKIRFGRQETSVAQAPRTAVISPALDAAFVQPPSLSGGVATPLGVAVPPGVATPSDTVSPAAAEGVPNAVTALSVDASSGVAASAPGVAVPFGAVAPSPDTAGPSPAHVSRISRPRLRPLLLPPLSEIMSDRNVRGKDLGKETP